MIWHFFEVWVLMVAAFAIGCPLGALAYRAVAESPLADLQGGLADAVGDLVDEVKRRFGIGPVWRPGRGHAVERPMGGAEHLEAYGDARIEPEFLPVARRPLMIADRAPPPEAKRVVDDRPSAAPPAIAYEIDEPLDAPDEEEDLAVARPVGLAAPRNGVPDDLQRIRGVGKRIERRLNGLGIYHFGQIAAWTPAEMRWVAKQLAFPERIAWDDWIGQAVILAAGGDTGFIKSADRRRRVRRDRAIEAELTRALEEGAETGDTSETADDDAAADAEAQDLPHPQDVFTAADLLEGSDEWDEPPVANAGESGLPEVAEANEDEAPGEDETVVAEAEAGDADGTQSPADDADEVAGVEKGPRIATSRLQTVRPRSPPSKAGMPRKMSARATTAPARRPTPK